MLKHLYIILALLLCLNVCVSWHYSRESGLDSLYNWNSSRNIGTMHHEYYSSSICIHDYMIKDEIMISYYLGQPLNRFKENKLVWASGKVNPTITYRNEFDPKNYYYYYYYCACNSPACYNHVCPGNCQVIVKSNLIRGNTFSKSNKWIHIYMQETILFQ